MDLTDNFLRMTGQRSVRSLALKLGTPPASLARQLKDNTLPLETMVAMARAFDLDLLAILVEVGQITEKEGAKYRGVRGLEAYSDLELAGEVYRRTAESASMIRA